MGDVGDLASSLSAVSKRLKDIGEQGLARELAQGVSRTVAPIPEKIRSGLPGHMPNRYAGVLNADLSITRSSSYSGDKAKVVIKATTRSGKRRRIRRLDQGDLEHPLFGRRKHWYSQRVEPGWFSRTVGDAAPEVREAIEEVLNDVAAKAAGK